MESSQTLVDKPQIVKVATLGFRQSQRSLIGVLWLLVIIVVIAYTFQIWNGVASITMLQTAMMLYHP